MLINLAQPEKAYSPIFVTLFGIIKSVDVLPIAYCNNVFPSLVYKLPSITLKFSLLLNSILASLVQFAKTPLPKVFNVDGRVTDSKSQYANAL